MRISTCFAHISQYFSITLTPPPTSNNASVVMISVIGYTESIFALTRILGLSIGS